MRPIWYVENDLGKLPLKLCVCLLLLAPPCFAEAVPDELVAPPEDHAQASATEASADAAGPDADAEPAPPAEAAPTAEAGEPKGSAEQAGTPNTQPENDKAAPKKEKPDSGELDEPLEILGTRVKRGETHRLLWVASETSYGSKLETPVYVIRGKKPGPTLCLTSAIHGDELNGVEIVRQLVSDLPPKSLAGTVIGVPIVNLLGFTRGTRYLPDRRDLNRYFPGNPNGSSASRIAFSFFEDIVRHCDMLIDLHTGSLNRTNMPQVRANLTIPEVLEFTTKFGSTAVLHSRKLRGNLRSAATNVGIPAVALELGEPGSLQGDHIASGVQIISTVLSGLNMTRRPWILAESQPVFYSSRWVRVNYGGLLIAGVDVGARVKEGQTLGLMVNPLTNESSEVVSPYSGRILGMALNQFMLPGYAAFNVGIVSDEDTVTVDAQSFECSNTEMSPDQVAEEFGCAGEDDEEVDLEQIDVDSDETDDDSDMTDH